MRDTSIAAVQSIGDAEQLRARVLVEIRQRGGATCDEVEQALDLRHQTASARVRELQLDGKVIDGGDRRPTRSGRTAIVWIEAEQPPINSFSGEYRFLSNFWMTPVVFEGKSYLSIEHAYQAAKSTNVTVRQEIAAALTATEAKFLGKGVVLREDWETVKFDVMERVLRAKFAQPELAARLIATGRRALIEGNHWGDRIWGVCNGAGENHLGRLLMQIRGELQRPVALEPVLKWAGKKTFLLPKLRQLRAGHEHRRWVEPFVGSMAVALGLRPKEALLRDENPHLVNLHQWLQKGFLERSEWKLNETDNTEQQFYHYRDTFNGMIEAGCGEEHEMAMLFYYLNRTCYNGLCRFNTKGFFNTPYGKRAVVHYKTDFSEYKAALAGWQIEHGSFEKTALRSGDFVYLDPPYDGTFTDYSAGGFSWEQQEQLATMFAAHDGPIVASNAATAQIINLYRRLGFDVEFVAAPRSIAADASKRGAVLEILATKNLTARC